MKKFEVTEFHTIRLGAKWFVKLHSERFNKFELSAIQNLRVQLNRRYSQRKDRKDVPEKWRLVIESFGPVGEMRGQIFVEPPGAQPFNVTAFGTTEKVCELLWERLTAAP